MAAALLAAAVVAVLWWPERQPPKVATPPLIPDAAPAPAPASVPDPASMAASAPSPVLAAASAPEPAAPAKAQRYEVLSAAAGSTQARIARELAAALSTEPAPASAASVPDGTDPITWLKEPGRLAIVRLDALRAARGSAAPPLRVLAPLFPEEVLFIVRADSPLKYIHQLKGRRLSIGPTEGDGAQTVRGLYRRMFGADVPAPAQFSHDQALAELVAFRSIDAMAVVGPLPSAWWASLDKRTARGLRLLSLDPGDPAGRKLLQGADVSAARTGAAVAKGGPPATTPAVMSFLVASGEGDADVGELTAMANALCRELPRLRKQGHPKWRELQPGAKVDSGWPVVRPVQAALSGCARR
jgi:uncharacterized protein